MPKEKTVERGVENELKSLEEVCSSTWEPLYRFIYYKVQNREEAEEITQETYVKALSRFGKTNVKPDNYLGFLKTVSLNILRDRWRRRKRRGVHMNLEKITLEELALGPEESYARREIIENALKKLSEEQRKVIELRIIKGYSVVEAGKIMNKKDGTIRVLQYRALKALTKILKGMEEI